MNILRYLTFLTFVLFFSIQTSGALIQSNDINIFSFASEESQYRYNPTATNLLRKTNKRQQRTYDYTLPSPISTLAAHTDGAVALSQHQNSFYFITNRPCTDDLKTISLHGKPMDVYIDGDQVYVTVQIPGQTYGHLMIYSRLAQNLVTTLQLHPNAHRLAGNESAIFVAHGTEQPFTDGKQFCGTGLSIIQKADFSKQSFHRTSESPHFIYANDTHVFITTKTFRYFLMGTAPDYELKEKRVAFGPQHLLLTPSMVYVLSEFSKNVQGLDANYEPKKLSIQLDGHPLGIYEADDAIIVLTRNKDLLYFFEKLTLRHLGTLRVSRDPLDLCVDLNDIQICCLGEINTIPESTYRRFIVRNQEINAQATSFDELNRGNSPSLSDNSGGDDFDFTQPEEE